VVTISPPQFEAGRIEASRAKGVIRDPEIHRRTLGEVADALDAAGAVIMGAMPSPITGSAGNIEFLLHAHAPQPDTAGGGLAERARDGHAMAEAAVAEAHHHEPRG
jgi:hypothetical protein